VGFAETVHGGLGEDGFHAVRAEDLAVLFGREKAGREDIDAHAPGRPFAREVLREVMNGGLGGGVGEHAGERLEAGGRANVDDAAGAAVNHMFAKNLAGEDDAFEVHGDDFFKLFLGDVEERRGGIDARAVDEDVHFSEFGDGIGQQFLQAGLGGGVAGKELGLASVFGDVVEVDLGFVLVAPHDGYGCACGGYTLGHCAA